MARHDKRLKQGSLLGPYRIIRLIGEGGMGEVYEARDEALNRHVALKVISPKFAAEQEIIKRFMSEGQTLARLNHQNVVVVYALGEENGIHYIVMEYVDGYSLHEILKIKGTLSVDEALHQFKQLLQGVKALHESGIIHRDIKPKNIIVRKDNSVKIVDFGIAKIEGQADQEITKTGELVGSVYYVAPEVIEHSTATIKSDIWSLGVNLYEMLNGKNPFEARKWSQVVDNITKKELTFARGGPSIPPKLKRMIMKMCEKNPALRYSSVDEILQDLKDIKRTELIPVSPAQETSVLAVEETIPQPIHSGSYKHSSKRKNSLPPVANPKASYNPSAVMGLAVVLAIGGAAWYYNRNNSNSNEIPVARIPAAESAPASVTPPPESPATPPPAPNFTLHSPSNGQKILVGDQEAVRLDWSGEANEGVYLQIAKDPQFNELIVEEAHPKSPYNLRKIKDDGIYYWRMVQKASGTAVALTEPVYFTAITQTSPQLIYPVSQIVYPESQTIKFYWQEKQGVSQYRFQLALDPFFQRLVKDVLLRENQTGSITPPPGDYYWRVRAEENPSASSLWSEARTVRVQPMIVKSHEKTVEKPKKEKVSKEKYRNRNSISEEKPRAWAETKPVVEKAKTVAVEMPKVERQPKVPVDLKTPRNPASETALPGPFGRSHRGGDVQITLRPASPSAAKAPVAERKVEPKAPVRAVTSVPAETVPKIAAPKIKLPPNGVSIVSLSGDQDPISFRWENINGAQGYRLEISSREDFSKILYSMSVRENQTVLTKKMPKGRVYWRVRAEKGAAKSDWSMPFYFEISK